MTNQKNNTDLLIADILEGIQKVKGQDITILDLRTIENAVCSHFIICTGSSNTQVTAISGAVQKMVSQGNSHQKPWHIEGEQNAEWILLDYIDVVVHIFQKSTREYYDIEGLWGDAKITQIETNY
ncbi:ribosome silencing factor [Capnocytophaga catalasegens]|uniref:Ribosomal silencing factor RsfS n=1 Tax=Capnocytophaga catalasegens TaxID=1004260 RepID=A0AAV5AY12_9FLAO|nr:ribosome silencing factor [Capnocytophaga catalasegens]GIZ16456.1 ribosomal silencing factor RsfS [Capnocytophaga catalasegens]GJM50305.1 ribosomal silencing factor RsfS [Capnocytophaga catalasegens]GJM53822.1 ribosomal silencing factor RsfS [Capnocytophaga catalasegens]